MKIVYKKGLSIFLSLIVIIATINFSLALNTKKVDASNVEAATINCCEWTNDNNFCVESADVDFKNYAGCKPGYLSSYSSCAGSDGCKLGTCVPSGAGECLSNKFKVACEHENKGKWINAPIDQVSDCKIGCCNVANSLCSLEEKKACIQDLANGDVNAFNGEITTSQDCDNSCRKEDLGTCKTDYGCKVTTRGKCTGTFYLDKYPRDITGCFVTSHAYKSCGDGTTNDDKFNVYFYDSANNREEIAKQCKYPDEYCNDPDGIGGNEATCVTTSCIPIEAPCLDCDPQIFRTGESVCLNVLEGHFTDSRRSKSLQNYILHCQWGEIVPDTQDNNREQRCVQSKGTDGRVNAKWNDNKWENCPKCGGESKLLDWAGFVPLIGPPISAGLLFGLGDACTGEEEEFWTWGLGEQCSSKGDCGSIGARGEKSDDYDNDFIWPPIGSCNPMYPPGRTDRCGECGEGGDSTSNLCTEDECNHLGDCQFEQEITRGLGAAGGLALGTCGAALFVSYGLCNIPLIQGGCPGFLEGAKSVCMKFGGKKLLFWGLVQTFYSLGAGAATKTQEFTLDYLKTKEGKFQLGPMIALAKGAWQNLSEGDPETLSYLERSAKGAGIESAIKAINYPVLVPTITAGLAALGPHFTSDLAARTLEYSLGKSSALVGEFGPLPIAYTLSTVLTIAGLATSYFVLADSFNTGKCSAEKPYTNNLHCSECGGKEGQWYCTQERCNILGNCRWLVYNESAQQDGICVPKDISDINPPYVTKINVKFLDRLGNLKLEKSSNSKSLDINDQISWNVLTLRLNINTNERANCKYITTAQNSYDNSLSLSGNEYKESHELELNMTESDKVNGLTLYFKCEDINGNKIRDSDDTNFIKFQFERRPDTEPPVIQRIDPINAHLPDEIRNIRLSVVAYDNNDVAECKYSKTSSNYQEMESTFTRDQNKIPCQDIELNECRLFTTNINLEGWGEPMNISNYNKEIMIYNLSIKCKDSENNTMIDAQHWDLKRIPIFSMNINNPLENEKIWARRVLINVTTSVSTNCNYTIDNREFVLSNNKFNHVKENDQDLNRGAKTLNVKCRDSIVPGNEVTLSRNFEIMWDDIAPEVTKVYKESNKLCVVLNEESECRYSNEDNFPEAWKTDDNGMIDGLEDNSYCSGLDEEKIYYIMCSDLWANNATFTIYP